MYHPCKTTNMITVIVRIVTLLVLIAGLWIGSVSASRAQEPTGTNAGAGLVFDGGTGGQIAAAGGEVSRLL